MEPYCQLFPDDRSPVMTLDLERKTGPIPKGSYGYLECYCTDPACDCRRVTVIVLNEKMKQKAVICFGFDAAGPFAGPYLDASIKQAPYAVGLLDFFVYSLNTRPDCLTRMYRHYREVRELVEGRPYRGKAFPRPEKRTCRAMPAPDLVAELEQSLKQRRNLSSPSVPSAGMSGASGGDPFSARGKAACRDTMMAKAGRSDLQDLPEEVPLAGIVGSFKSMGLSSTFECAQEMHQLLAMNEPELQAALTGEMMRADNPLLRDISALMIFHHDPDLALEASRLLAGVEGNRLTPETLRRLIVSRNWLSGPVRKNVDQAITRARRARVECAPLAKPPAMTVYASSIDGGGAQGLLVLIPDGAAFIACSLLLRLEAGVADCFVLPLKSKRKMDSFLADVQSQGSYLESSPEYLDQRVCHALAEGARQGRGPGHGLVHIAELLGRDRWKGIPFDAESELLQLRQEIAAHDPRVLDGQEYLAALRESVKWHHLFEPVFGSWFLDDESVSLEIEATRGGGKTIDVTAAVGRILSVLLEGEREAWLERLVVNALWLKYAKNPPLPLHRMFHVAQAVADRSTRLQEIPLMVAVATMTFDAYLQRSKSGRRKRGAAA